MVADQPSESAESQSVGFKWASSRQLPNEETVAPTKITTTSTSTTTRRPARAAATMAPAELEAGAIRATQMDTSDIRGAHTDANAISPAGGQHQAADYVRAIKLVRGVSYPWPPPTKSSQKTR